MHSADDPGPAAQGPSLNEGRSPNAARRIAGTLPYHAQIMTQLPDYADALQAALEPVTPIRETEAVSLGEAPGRVLAEPIVADRDLPPFNRAQMDGYALRASEFGMQEAWPVVATIAAGHGERVSVPPGSCAAIATGAVLPDDVDTVIQHEVSDRGDLQGEPVRFSIESIKSGHAVHPSGADAKAGDQLVAPGTLLMPHHLGIAATVGQSTLDVVRQPRAAVLTSGDEVVSPEHHVHPHQIRNSNGPMLAALLARLGANVIAHHHLPDELDPTIRAVGEAIHTADLLITVGGVSAGDRDHFPAAFDEHTVNRVLHGASIQPGKPIFIGRAAGSSATGCIVIGLPGNPVSALVCSTLFIQPIVRGMLGLKCDLSWREAVLSQAVKPNPSRRAFRPCVMHSDGRLVTVPDWAGSGDLCHTAPTTGIVELPVQAEYVAGGTSLRYLPWP